MTELMADVRAQKDRLPEIYGAVDFDAPPVRFTTSMADSTTFTKNTSRRAEVLARQDLVDVMRAYTMRGDPTADAYAALMTKGYRLSELITMLKTACAEDLDAVANAPDELKDLIHDMERVPDWLDIELANEGARYERNMMANLTPYVERGSFIGTYLNKYSALPMALTGALSDKSAKRRIFETSNFVMQTTLPGGLTRHSEGFKAAAMVRMMHSMVRINLLTRGKWDSAEYGIPIPQVDQMPAGLFFIYTVAKRLVRKGRSEFTPAERAQCEFARYRCFLLGLPEVLLPATPAEIIDIFDARQATLKNVYDEDICAPLIRATMNANLAHDDKVATRIRQAMSISLGKVFFMQYFASDPAIAKKINFALTPADRMRNLVSGPLIAIRMATHGVAANLPVARQISDRILISRMKTHLSRIGHAEFVSDGSQYRPRGAAANQ